MSTCNISNLASIALAMAELEKVPEPKAPTLDSPIPSFDPPRTGGPPPRRDFHQLAPRTVSTDSTEDSSLLHASLIKNDSSEDESIIFDNSSSTDPPPPPPSPDEVISKVMEADVLCGRGGETNNHSGNVHYRNLVKQHQRVYLKAKRRDKPKIARQIVDAIRRRNGRFLKKDTATNTWRDVGNTKAREKTSQALREGAPELREPKQQVLGIPSYEQQVVYKKRKLTSPTEYHHHSSPINLVSPTPSTIPDLYVGCPAAVSADDDDMSPSSKKMKRGPRLAILKARLMSED